MALLSSRSKLFILGLFVPLGACDVSTVHTAPIRIDTTLPPDMSAPTGTRWTEGTGDAGCGRTTVRWVLEDEMCNAAVASGDLRGLVSPMFRDGLSIGGRLYAVDASFVWVLEPVNGRFVRRRMVSGLGQPLALATHAGRLLIAAGNEGLLIADLSDPDRPRRLHRVDVGGSAIALEVRGDLAYVAAGRGGLAIVDLAAATPAVMHRHRVDTRGGFGVAVSVTDDHAYLAACNGLAIVELEGQSLAGYVMIPGSVENGVLVAPVKDVAVIGDVAFTASGRYGAIAIDVSNKSQAAPIGHCTESQDLRFYASGVKTDGQRLYIAAGEWGVKTIDVSSPEAACTGTSRPTGLNTTNEASDCVDRAPWISLPAAPVPGHDPIQIRLEGEVLYAFGDATRVGLRALDIYDTKPSEPIKVGRYEEPRLVTGIAARGEQVITLGDRPRYHAASAGQLREVPDSLPSDAVGAAFLDDGRWVVATSNRRLIVQDEAVPIPLPEGARPERLAVSEGRIALSVGEQVFVAESAFASVITRPIGHSLRLSPVLAFDGRDVVVAAPEWTEAQRVSTLSSAALAPHGVFSKREVANPEVWRDGAPARLLVATPHGLVELAAIGKRAGLVLHRGARPSVSLPPGSYTGGALVGEDRVALVTGDRGSYRSALIIVHITEAALTIEHVSSFTGVAVGVASTPDWIWVADADAGVRVYRAGAAPVLTEVVAVGGGS